MFGSGLGEAERVMRQGPTPVKHLKLVLSVPWHRDATEGKPMTEMRYTLQRNKSAIRVNGRS